jgi:hypothetical protein
MQIRTSFTPPRGSDIILRHPMRAADFQAIAHLRQELNLAVHAGLDPQFLEHEKKETN